MHRTGLNETALVSEMPIVLDKKNVIMRPGQGKIPASLLHDNTYEELAFLYSFFKRKIWKQRSSRYTSKHSSIL